MGPVIHIAGTNGKGSTCAFIGSALQALGFRVGTFTSPHLFCYTERICIQNTPISQHDFSHLLTQILKTSPSGHTEFEYLTCLAFLYFKQHKPDFILLETGLGGRLDTTNVVTPILSIITKIGYDHQAILGNSLAEIAFEKAGIIKKNTPVITSTQQDSRVLTVLETVALKQNATLILTEPCQKIPNSFLMRGEFQTENVSLARQAIQTLLPEHNSRKREIGLARARHLGRFDTYKIESNTVIFDAAHNPPAMDALLHSLEKQCPETPLVFVLGFLKTKDTVGILSCFQKYQHTLFYCDFSPGLSVPFSEIIETEKTQHIQPFSKPSELGTLLRNHSHATIVITGSIFFLGKFFSKTQGLTSPLILSDPMWSA